MANRLVLFVLFCLVVAACGTNDAPGVAASETTAPANTTTEEVAEEAVVTNGGSADEADPTAKVQPTEADDEGAPTPTDPPATPDTTSAPATTSQAPTSTTTSTTTTAPTSTTTAAPTPTTTAAPSPSSTSAPVEPETAPNITELARSERVLNIAHAGGDQAYPHSTLFAFAKSVEDGVDILEMDVQLTADGQLVVFHDETVEKRTNKTDRVDSLTLAELQSLDGSYWFAPGQWPRHDLADDAYIYRGVSTGDVAPPDGFAAADFGVATFRQVAERFPTMPLDIEMKGANPEVATVLANEIISLGREESTIVVAFDDSLIAKFSEAAPTVATSPGLGALTGWVLNGDPLGDHVVIQVPPFYSGIPVVTQDTIELANKSGFVVWVWPNDAATQENAEFYQSMLDIGAQGMIVGQPAEFERLLN